MITTVFRLKTAVEMIGVEAPVFITPTIAEPILWADCRMSFEVDEKYHGVLTSYSRGDLKLVFHCENAYELIIAQYRRYGIDAEVEFLVVEIDDNDSEYVEFRGKLHFPTISIKAGEVSISIIENNIHNRVAARWDVPVALDGNFTLDNGFIIAPTPIEIPLPGQTISEKGDISKTKRVFETKEDPQAGMGGLYTLLPNMNWPNDQMPIPADAQSLLQMEGVFPLPGGIIKGGHEGQPFIEEKYAADYHIEFDYITKVNMAISRDNAVLEFGRVRYSGWSIEPLFIIQQPGKADEVIAMAPRITGSGETLFIGERQVTVHLNLDFSLVPGSKVYIFTKLVAFATKALKQLSFSADTSLMHVKLERKTRAEASRTTAYLLPDALRFVSGVITNALDDNTGTGAVEGSLIDYSNANNPFDGYATEYAVASGGQLRGLKKAPTFTFKELIDTLWAQHAAGILYQRNDTTGKESIRIEEGAWFYRGGEILRIEEVFEYQEEIDTEQLYNQIEVGYSKFPDSGPGVGEEFNTTHTYQTPIVNSDAKHEIICPLIAAGTAIEEARRLGLTKTDENGKVIPSTDAGSYDDDNFLLHVGTQTYTDTVQFFIKPPQPFPGKPYTAYYVQFSTSIINKLLNGISLKYGDIIVFSGTNTAMDGVPMFVGNLVKSGSIFKLLNAIIRPTYEIILPTTFIETANPIAVSWRLGSQPAKLRTDERLLVTGLTDPGSTANLELSPARMLRKHALFINSGLFYKQKIDEIRCTAYKHNSQLTTRVRPEVAPLPGDQDKQRIRETGNVALGAFERFEKLFEPLLIKVTGRITKQEARKLRDALRNRSADESINMGYVTVLNPDNNYVSGYVRSLDYDPRSEVVEMVLRKKADPSAIVDCSFYYSKNFGYFEGNNGADPNIYRFCRFSDFAS